MSCYCKESTSDQKDSVKDERPKNLYEEDDDDDNETYMDELVNTLSLEKAVQECGSTPSLPEVAVASDRCESKMEIPWLKISLPPPGFYEIKTMEGRPKRVVCDCWNLSANDEIYVEQIKVQEDVFQPICKCMSEEPEEKPGENTEKPDENINKPNENIDKPDKNIDKPDKNIDKPDENIEEPNKNIVKPDENIVKPDKNIENPDKNIEDPDQNVENPDENAVRPEENTEDIDENTENPEENIENPDENTEEPIENIETPDENIVKPDENIENPDENIEKPDENVENTDENTEKPDENTDNPDENIENANQQQRSFRMPNFSLKRRRNKTKGENDEDDNAPEEKPPPLQEPAPPKNLDLVDDSDSSSVPSSCICIPPADECEDMLGKPTLFVYDNPCLGQNEPYMEPIYKLYPDECDTYCGPHIEMPWSDLIIPRNIKLKHVKKNPEQKKTCTCDNDKLEKQEEIISCGEKTLVPTTDKSNALEAIAKTSDNMLALKDSSNMAVAKPSGNRVVMKTTDNIAVANKSTERSFEIQLSLTEIINNMTGQDKAPPSEVSVSVKPCKDRGSSTEPRSGASNYSRKHSSCRCRSPKSKTSNPTSSKRKNSNSKSSNRDIETSNIESTASQRSKCKSPSCRSSNCKSQTHSKKSRSKGRLQDHVMNVLETCEAEMEPLRVTLNQLKSKIRNLNITELSNWNGSTGESRQGPSATNTPMSIMPLVKPPSPPMCRPLSMPSPSQNFFSMQPPPPLPPPQFGFPPPFGGMFPPMALPPMPLPSMPPFPSARGCCPKCACNDIRLRKKSAKYESSSDFSDDDSVTDEESPCPFLRALSSKNISKALSKSQRKDKNLDKQERPSSNHSKKSKKQNKRNQVEYSCQDNCTDTEPEIQVYYGPKYPRVRTKQVFKNLVDPSTGEVKNQRLRIAVKVTPSGQALRDENLLAIQAPNDINNVHL